MIDDLNCNNLRVLHRNAPNFDTFGSCTDFNIGSVKALMLVLLVENLGRMMPCCSVGWNGWLYLLESRPLDSEGSLVSLGFWPG